MSPSVRLLRAPGRERRRLQQEVLPVLILSDLVQLQLHERWVVVGVKHVQGLVPVDPVERRPGENLYGYTKKGAAN